MKGLKWEEIDPEWADEALGHIVGRLATLATEIVLNPAGRGTIVKAKFPFGTLVRLLLEACWEAQDESLGDRLYYMEVDKLVARKLTKLIREEQ